MIIMRTQEYVEFVAIDAAWCSLNNVSPYAVCGGCAIKMCAKASWVTVSSVRRPDAYALPLA
jgi:hypothetical protein